MKKYRALSRIFLLSYLVLIFCGVLFGFLLVKSNLAVALVLIGLAVVDWAALITAKHLFNRHYQAFLIISVIGIAYVNIASLGALIIEIIYTAQGLPAHYAWMISIISVLFCVVIDIYYVLSIKAIHHKKMVEQGLVEEEKEEEV